ncbi:A1 cistron-splicing factor [Mycotypha africana]|uniref:A1 cistron-splicing factor n=1 Tax=Mycotypha africana TaxID=64632 RepID=UPI0023013A04|nr:A1 cistron-splicing factor [Mycotypha africana]KAI8967137.1 A1 cistron-splicing factor [Mycotypha africana]
MDQQLANQLFEKGAFLLFLEAPPHLEFGVDYHAWTIGPLFKGVKMIPPGLHFIYYSALSKEGAEGIRTGFFHFFESKEVLVREWNPHIEDLRDETELDPDQVERLRSNIRDFDRNMGPYPLDPPTFYERWKQLTNYITPGLVHRILPNNGKVSHLPEKGSDSLEPSQDTNNSSSSSSRPPETLDPATIKDQRLGKQIEKEQGMEFTPFVLRHSFPKGAVGQEVTRWSLDKSWLTRQLLNTVYHGDYKVLLGELQLAFVCLLMAQNFSGFNQWKQLVQLMCSCQQLVEEMPDLFYDFMDVLQCQLNECPEDFYRDILSENNFTTIVLKTLQRNIPLHNERLGKRFMKLKRFIIKKFDWEISDHEDDEEEEEGGENAPVIVDLEE